MGELPDVLGCCSPTSGRPLHQGIPFPLRVEVFCWWFCCRCCGGCWLSVTLCEVPGCLTPVGLGCFGGALAKALGGCCHGLVRRKAGFCGVLGTVFLWPGRRGERIREQDPNFQTHSPSWGGPGCLGKLHSRSAGANGDEEREATLLMSPT